MLDRRPFAVEIRGKQLAENVLPTGVRAYSGRRDIINAKFAWQQLNSVFCAFMDLV